MSSVEITTYCPQCILFVFAAMGVYQYVIRDRIRNGATDETDELYDGDIGQMDEQAQLMLLNLLATDHTLRQPAASSRPAQDLARNDPSVA